MKRLHDQPGPPIRAEMQEQRQPHPCCGIGIAFSMHSSMGRSLGWWGHWTRAAAHGRGTAFVVRTNRNPRDTAVIPQATAHEGGGRVARDSRLRLSETAVCVMFTHETARDTRRRAIFWYYIMRAVDHVRFSGVSAQRFQHCETPLNSQKLPVC